MAYAAPCPVAARRLARCTTTTPTRPAAPSAIAGPVPLPASGSSVDGGQADAEPWWAIRSSWSRCHTRPAPRATVTVKAPRWTPGSKTVGCGSPYRAGRAAPPPRRPRPAQHGPGPYGHSAPAMTCCSCPGSSCPGAVDPPVTGSIGTPATDLQGPRRGPRGRVISRGPAPPAPRAPARRPPGRCRRRPRRAARPARSRTRPGGRGSPARRRPLPRRRPCPAGRR